MTGACCVSLRAVMDVLWWTCSWAVVTGACCVSLRVVTTWCGGRVAGLW